jgi:hypothetical protein
MKLFYRTASIGLSNRALTATGCTAPAPTTATGTTGTGIRKIGETRKA